MNPDTRPFRPLFLIYGALIALLALTAWLSALPLGAWASPASMGVATVKALLIACFFMRLRSQGGLVRVFAVSGLFVLLILLVLSSADYFARP